LADTFLTLAAFSKGLYKEKGSRFISLAFPARSEEEIKEILNKIKKEYHDARHICYAYILGKEQNLFKANDAGEPYYSAGDPILGQIRSNYLTNALVVVVRYFGGTKLGVSGLINAYKTAAAEAIANNKIIEQVVKEQIILHFPYPSLNDVMKVIKDYDLDIAQQNFEINCQMTIFVRQQLFDQVCAIFENMPDVQIQLQA
jgi:uncharacterized YigZ family protein